MTYVKKFIIGVLVKLLLWLNSGNIRSLKCVVIDIETMATSVNAKVFSIGIVVGDLATGDIQDMVQINVSLDSQPTRVEDLRTKIFWDDIKKQEPIAWEKNTSHQLTSVKSFLDIIDTFLARHPELPVFGNGPEFDNATLADLYNSIGRKLPWQYRNNQSVRTMVLLGRILFGFDPKYDDSISEGLGLVKHVALDDAIMEFKYCSAIYRKMISRLL